MKTRYLGRAMKGVGASLLAVGLAMGLGSTANASFQGPESPTTGGALAAEGSSGSVAASTGAATTSVALSGVCKTDPLATLKLTPFLEAGRTGNGIRCMKGRPSAEGRGVARCARARGNAAAATFSGEAGWRWGRSLRRARSGRARHG